MKRRLPHLRLFFLFIIFTIFLSYISYLPGPGLTTVEPIGAYVNGIFPSEAPTAKPYRIAFPNLKFDSPTSFKPIPNSNVIIVGQLDGKIYWFNNDENTTTKNLLADFSDDVGIVLDGGFLETAVHPDFGQLGKNYMYMWYTTRDSLGGHNPRGMMSGFGCIQEEWYWGNHLVLKRVEVDPVNFTMVANSEVNMLDLRMYGSTHRGGGLVFGDDGFLYLSTGDQTGYSRPQNLTDNLDGGVLRIDVDKDPTKSHAPIRKMQDVSVYDDEVSGVEYWIPNDNPFLSPDGSNYEEYYTIGHRNPYRMTKDRTTGTMYIGEVGESTHEEINVVSKGKNYGWPVFEGNAPGPSNCTTLYNNMEDEKPLVAFPRSDANAIIGGYVYRGSDVPQFYGKYICADFGSGEEIWAVDTATGEYDLLTQFSPTDVISFGEDHDGELYLLSYGDEVSLYKIIEPTIDSSNIPTLLSETGLFDDVENFVPSAGVIPYGMVEPFWSDGALKRRWFVVPNDGTYNTPEEQIGFTENGDWTFPIGSALVKHLEMPIDEGDPTVVQRLETRIEIRANDGSFYYLVYKWNEQGTDAVLLDGAEALAEELTITREDGSTKNMTWYYPSRQQCYECHGNAGILGPATRYLNNDETYEKTGITANQLVTLSHLGLISETIDDNTAATYQTHKRMDDPNATLEEKARSYLDLNCGYCHRPDRSGARADFDLRLFNTLEQTGLLTAEALTPVIGVQGNQIVVPGDADNSILFHRTNSVDPTIMMPPLGKTLIDVPGTALVEDWINSLTTGNPSAEIPEGVYQLTNVGSQKLMDIENESLEPVADIVQNSLSTSDGQRFSIAANDVYYTLQSELSNLYLDVEGDGLSSGTNVVQYYAHGGDNQLWIFEDLGNDTYAIKSKSNGHYLGIEGNSNADGASVKTYLNDGSDFMKWTLTLIEEVNVTSVSLSPGTLGLAEGETGTLTATVEPANADDTTVSWTSSDESVATVDGNGVVTAISEGVTTITVTTNDGGFTATTGVTVSATSISVTGVSVSPTTMDLAEGETGTLTATVEPANADDTTVSWTSSDESVATVDGNGVVTAISEGVTTITVTTNDGGFTATTGVTVSATSISVTGVSVSPTTMDLAEGETGTLTATVEPANADDTTVSWTSSDESVATVDGNGVVTAISEGVTTITVTTNDGGFTATTGVTVSATSISVTGVSVSPTTMDLAEGETGTLTATVEPANADDTTVSWTSSDESVATVDGNGVVTAISEGVTTITVTTNDGGFTATTGVTVSATSISVTGVSVSPTTMDLAEGETGTLTATVEPANADDTTVSWTSSDESVATVDGNGVVTAISEGVTTITVTTNDGGFTATTGVTVSATSISVTGVSVSPTTMDLAEGETGTLTATVEPANADDTTVSWTSSDESVATVDGNGVVTAISEGVTTITVTTNDGGFTATTGVTVSATSISVTGVSVSPTTMDLAEGETGTLTATVEPANADDTTVSWTSSDESVATVDGNGVVTAISEGVTTITVTTNDGGFTATTGVTVSATSISVTGVSVSPTTMDLAEGETGTLTATVEPANADDTTVSWTSSDESVATVDGNGVVTAISEGVTTITVTTNNGGFEAQVIVTVLISGSNTIGEDPIVYPNPTSGFLSLDLSPYQGKETTITVFNELQQMIFKRIFSQNHAQTEEIDVGEFSGGAYYIVFETDDDRDAKIFLLRK